MNDFDIINELNKILDMNSMTDFVIIGAFLGALGFAVFNFAQKSVPGLVGMMLPGLAGAILGAMLYIFAEGTSK